MDSRFIQAGDLRVHYLEAGRGEPLVLLHDWPQTSDAWRRIAPLLANHYCVIAPDMRGLGGTDRPGDGYDRARLAQDVLDFMDALKLDGATLIGHGLGGMVAAKVAFEQPRRVQRLVLLDAVLTGWPASVAHFHWFFDGDRAEQLFEAHAAELVRALIGGLPVTLPRPPACPIEFSTPAFATRLPFADMDELEACTRAFATPSARAALVAPFRALRFHRRLPDTHADKSAHSSVVADAVRSERWEALSSEEMGAMWRDGRGGRSCLDFAPEDRHRRFEGAVLWIYNQYLLDFANAWLDDEGRPAGDEALESFLRHFPRVEARGIDAGHYFPQEKPEITAQLLRKFLKKN